MFCKKKENKENVRIPEIKNTLAIFNELCKKIQDNLFKVIVIGDPGVGKTSIIKQVCLQRYTRHYQATIGVDFVVKRFNCGNEIVKMQLWDIAGQERYGQMTRVYYKDAIGAIMVFDVTREETFESVAKWKKDLDEKATLPDGTRLPCILLANKWDEPKKKGIANTPDELHKYAREKGFVSYLETSAKENLNLDEALVRLSSAILKKKDLFPYVEEPITVEMERTFNLSQRAREMEQSEAAAKLKKKCQCK